MKTIFKSVAVASLLAASAMASAQGWNFGGGYANYMEDEGIDINLGVIYGAVGYAYESGNMTWMPELRFGTGVSDDTVRFSGVDVDVEIDTFIVASLRGQYNVTETFGVFLQPSYGRLDVTASAQGLSLSDNTSEFGFGGGATFKVGDSASIEAIYETFDGSDVLSVGFRISL